MRWFAWYNPESAHWYCAKFLPEWDRGKLKRYLYVPHYMFRTLDELMDACYPLPVPVDPTLYDNEKLRKFYGVDA